MSMKKLLECVLFSFVSVYFRLPCCNGRTVTLAHGAWKGVIDYIPVNREVVQEKLDIYNSCQGSFGGPLLYLPKKLVFSDILDESQHIVYVEFGNLTVYNSDVFNPEDVPFYQSISRPEFSSLIPLLSNDPDGPPRFSLALDLFHPQNWSDLLNINIVFRYETVDQVSVNMNKAFVRDDSEEIGVYINPQNNSCLLAVPSIRRKFDMVLERELLLGISQPEFPPVCDFLEENYFCSVANSIKDDVISFSPNVCQIPWARSMITSYQVSLEVFSITPGFRERLLLRRKDPVYFIASETFEQYFDVAVKFPCVDGDGN